MKNSIAACLLFCLHLARAQSPADIALLKSLNDDVWIPFSASWVSGDVEQYIALHSDHLVRCSGGGETEIKNLSEYALQNRNSFKRDKEKGNRPTIGFRFLERVVNAEMASERGIYHYENTNTQGEKWEGYGKFHVIERREKGRWKILVDYDSNEGDTIGKDDWDAAFAPDDWNVLLPEERKKKVRREMPVAETGYDSLLAQKAGADDYGMKRYVLVLLKTGPNTTTDKPLIDSLFAGHMANIGRLAAEKKLVLAGPIGRKEKYRGVFVFNVTTVEAARELTDTDPAIKAGLLEPEFLPWYSSAALMSINELHERVQKRKM